MENFFYKDEFYYELGDLMEQLEIGEDNAHLLEDDYSLDCVDSVLEPLFKLDAYWITEKIDEERFPEESDSLFERLIKVLNDNIDFEKINALIPKVYYPSKEKFKLTKQMMIDYIS